MNVIRQDKYRPSYHFSPKSGWLNDPNGLVYFEGRYHLFYQHHPFGTTWGPMHWGHAVSTDLVTWEEQPIALEPDEHGMIFSGSAVVDEQDTSGFFGGRPGLVAIFTHHDSPPGTGQVRECQSLAYSTDSGKSWIKYADNPVLEDEHCLDFRDPKVFWHKPTEQWVMVLACGQTIRIYHSPNLKEWTFASEFGHGIGSHDAVWECPDLFPLHIDGKRAQVKWVMLVSIGDAPTIREGSRTQYFTGEFDGTTFVPDADSEKVRWLDHGRDNYAGVCWSDIPVRDGRRLFIGWMSNWRYANLTPTERWRGAMSIPRELTLETRQGKVALIQRPVRELEGLRTPVLSLKEPSLTEIRAAFSALQLDCYELVAEVATGGDFGFKVRVSDEQETLVGYASETQEVYVDRTRSGCSDFHEDFAGRHAVLLEEAENRLHIHIYVDRSSIEVFFNHGQVVITDLIFPDAASNGLEIFTADERITLYSLELYELK
ncbi:glycoside hydrolase family 32 protein [Paenibacillus kribbensis]|uniref:glycoside hydrolase family 32 protein n=1 Tax=Paenibacillus kribbensis TaxID=172713 RepID=UPI002DBC1587|nr:glycoside hydrolase family 32 protein [Paenibacillus kribbensis]MEC0232952.1 glycoside hydrolase family 32 protein [Paenibacillus kribbensis]